MMHKFRKSIAAPAGATLMALFVASTGSAQSPQKAIVDVLISPASSPMSTRPAMVSFIQSGEVVAQTEVLLNEGSANLYGMQVPAGSYDVRVEGEGLLTEVKRGARFLGAKKAELYFVMKSGQGLHTVTYAEGGLAREEVAVRLSALESRLDKLSRDPSAIVASPAGQTTDARTTGSVKWFIIDVSAVDAKTGLVTAVDPSTNRTFVFRAPTTTLRQIKAGQKAWANFDTNMVSLDQGDPCCIIVSR